MNNACFYTGCLLPNGHDGPCDHDGKWTASEVSAAINWVRPSWISRQQEAVIDFFVNASGHLVVRARAGTGKTTTIVEAVKQWLAANPGKTAVVCAFNTRIARELRKKFGLVFGVTAPEKEFEKALAILGVEVKTLHAIGFAACRRYRDGLKIEDLKKVEIARKDALARKVCGNSAPDAIVRMVAKLHTLARETTPHATNPGDLVALAIKHDCQPDEFWSKQGFGLPYVERMALAAMVLAADVKSGDTIDFSDMIFLPCRNGWLAGMWDLCVVDEAQDMTTAQLEIAVGSVNAGGRIAVVGDNRQAIYSFRGADAESLDRLKAELAAAELGLTVTYRCGRAIVAEAATLVPDFEAGEGNPEGSVESLPYANLVAAAGAGDFILSRVNAPLVEIAVKLLRSGKRARVAGKDLGKDLVTLVRKIKARTVPELLKGIEAWVTKETNRHRNAMASATNGRKKAIEAKIELVRDQADMLINLADGAKNLDEIQSRVDFLFIDDENLDGMGKDTVITCSSVHKAKGLEADRVFVLADTLRAGNIEEENIRYVAITRAKKELVYVMGLAA